MKLLWITKEKTNKVNSENVLQLEITEVVLLRCSTINNQYQHDSRVLSAFVPSNLFGQLLNASPTNHIYAETFHLEYP